MLQKFDSDSSVPVTRVPIVMTDMKNSGPNGHLDELFQRIPAALYRTSLDGEVLAANEAMAELLGYESVERLMATDGVASRAHVDPQERQRWRDTIEEHGIARDFPLRLVKCDGTVIWVRDTGRAIYDDLGQPRFFEGVLTDITTEVWASISSSILSDVLESTSDLVVVFDQDGSLRFANGASQDLLGLSPDRLGSKPAVTDLLPGIVWEEVLEQCRPGWSGEISMVDKDGVRRPLWVVVTTHRAADGITYLAGIGRDLTRMKQTQKRLEELVTAKDVFVATVSHELRNPLTGVMGLAEELRDRFDEFGDQERHDLITLIAHQAGEMTSLVEDLLVAIRSDVSEVAIVPEKCDLRSNLSEIALPSGVEYESEGELVAWADPQRLRQIVRNLLSNAERYGGSEIRLRVARRDDRIVFRVSDNGPGVAPENVERIFEPYQRADGEPIKPGSVGLGLNVARRLARLMGGDLVYRQEGEWATFALSLPVGDRAGVSAP